LLSSGGCRKKDTGVTKSPAPTKTKADKSQPKEEEEEAESDEAKYKRLSDTYTNEFTFTNIISAYNFRDKGFKLKIKVEVVEFKGKWLCGINLNDAKYKFESDSDDMNSGAQYIIIARDSMSYNYYGQGGHQVIMLVIDTGAEVYLYSSCFRHIISTNPISGKLADLITDTFYAISDSAKENAPRVDISGDDVVIESGSANSYYDKTNLLQKMKVIYAE
jgi:hypothetical protein